MTIFYTSRLNCKRSLQKAAPHYRSKYAKVRTYFLEFTMQAKLLNAETSYATHAYSASFSNEQAEYLDYHYKLSNRKRHRICFHQNTEVELHDIIIEYDKSSYIPPNKHVGKAETICLLQGKLNLFIFSDNGNCIEAIRLEAGSDIFPFLIRMPPNTWHGLQVASSEPCIVKETISGPYSRLSLMWGEFAPSEELNNKDGSGFRFYQDLSEDWRESLNTPKQPNYIKLTENVLQSVDQFPVGNKAIGKKLKEIAENSELQRARLCLHPNSSDQLQEMLIYLTDDCDIDTSYHINKDESLLVLDGSGQYNFINNDNSCAYRLPLTTFKKMRGQSDQSSCFARINRFLSHKIIPLNGGIFIYEATTGPFMKHDTAYRLVGMTDGCSA